MADRQHHVSLSYARADNGSDNGHFISPFHAPRKPQRPKPVTGLHMVPPDNCRRR